MDRPGAVAALRVTVTAFAEEFAAADDRWCVALSGGPDSLALTAVAAGIKPTTALIVDHRLQAGSERIAATAHELALKLGCAAAEMLRVDVGKAGGPEAAARTVRYQALDGARSGAPVLLGHTMDDQAETVLMGLGRGSGARSLAGMRPYDPPWCRPLLGVRRAATHAACAELGLTPWHDPHNADRRFTRVRLRTEVLPLLEEVLGGGVAEALARTAGALRADTDMLDELADRALHELSHDEGLAVDRLALLSDALRLRVIRGWLLAGGACGLTENHIRRVDTLVTAWRGQGGVAVGSPLRSRRLIAGRRDGMLTLHTEPV